MNAQALRLLAQAGLSADQIAEVAEALETNRRSTGAERQARYRQRKAKRDVTSDVTRDASPVFPTPLSSSEPKGSSEKVTNPRTRGSAKWRRVPEGWAPTPAVLAVGAAEGFTPGEIERELAKFRDHEFAVPKTDADAAFRRWLRTAAERRPSSTVIPLHERSRPTPRQAKSADYAEHLADIDRAMGAAVVHNRG